MAARSSQQRLAALQLVLTLLALRLHQWRESDSVSLPVTEPESLTPECNLNFKLPSHLKLETQAGRPAGPGYRSTGGPSSMSRRLDSSTPGPLDRDPDSASAWAGP
jgi:hypothetical protein